MSKHPIQRLVRCDNGILVASSCQLSLLSSTGDLVAQSASHGKALVQDLAVWLYHASNIEFMASIDDDKQLLVHSLPDLELKSRRTLSKRANRVLFAPDGQIVVGDKFGDVFVFPLQSSDVPSKLQPIVGHVSMINDMAFIPQTSSSSKPRLVTVDRDEHVRLSYFPKGVIIDKYLYGPKRFVSAVAVLSPSERSPEGRVVVGGGDDALHVWDVRTGELLSKPSLVNMQPCLPAQNFQRPTRAEKQAARANGHDGSGERADQASNFASSELSNFAISRILPVAPDAVIVSSAAASCVFLTTLKQENAQTSMLRFDYPVIDIFQADDSTFFASLEASTPKVAQFAVDQGKLTMIDNRSRVEQAIADAAHHGAGSYDTLSLHPTLALLIAQADEPGHNESESEQATTNKKRPAAHSPHGVPSKRARGRHVNGQALDELSLEQSSKPQS